MAVRPRATDSHGVAPAAQSGLFHEDVYDAVRELVAACGGAKAVGARVFPDLPPDAAGRRLLDCLDPSRAHKLELSQFVLLLRIGRETGCHAAMHYLADAAAYERPQTVEPEDQRAALQREFTAAVERLEQLARRIRSPG